MTYKRLQDSLTRYPHNILKQNKRLGLFCSLHLNNPLNLTLQIRMPAFRPRMLAKKTI